MKRILALLLVVATLFAIPTSVFAAEASETENTVVSENQAETKTAFKFGKFFKGIKFDSENKPTLPEGFEKLDMSKLKEKCFANFKNFDKEAIREKLDEMLAEGKITQEKYDAITSGELKPSFDGKKFPIFQNKKADVDNDTTDDSTAKTRPAFGKKTGGKFPAMKKGFKFAGAKG